MKRTNKHSGIDMDAVNERLSNCPDIMRKTVYIDKHIEGFFVYIEGLVNYDLVQRDFILPVVKMSLEELKKEKEIRNISCVDVILLYDIEALIDDVMEGSSVFICTRLPYAISCKLTEMEKRQVNEPVTEKNVKGPHEGFIEQLKTNLAILRRKIKNEALKFKTLTLGTQTKQEVVLAYIDGIANETLVDSLYKSVSKIKIDGLPTIGYIEQIIRSHPNSIFPQFLSTERPEKAMIALLEGRIVILLDGTPKVLIAPVSFVSFFQTTDDYSTLWIQGSFIRGIRIIAALIISVLLPAIYIAITTYHYYAIPMQLLIPLAESREKVPFPPIIEVIILETVIEMIREASVRLPTYVGTAISVVAGLIIGQAAVEANLVSNLLIVIVSATVVASYAIPSFDMALAIRILRLGFIVAASLFGSIGIVAAVSLAFAHLITMESLGQPYSYPFTPFSAEDMKDTLIRFPITKMLFRSLITRTKNKRRIKR